MLKLIIQRIKESGLIVRKKIRRYARIDRLKVKILKKLQGKETWRLRKIFWHFDSQSTHFSEQFGPGGEFRQQPEFMENASMLFSSFGYEPEYFAGKIILDVGAGSKLKSKYFVGSHIYALEPLAQRFMGEMPWSDLGDAEHVFSQPAEVPIKELINRVDFVMSINVLDHIYSPDQALQNIYAYLKPSGEFLLSVDLHDGVTHVGHPIRTTKLSIKRMLQTCGFEILREYHGLPYAEAFGEGKAYTAICRKKSSN